MVFKNRKHNKNIEFWKGQIEIYKDNYKSWDKLSVAEKKEAEELIRKERLLEAAKQKAIADYNIALFEKYITKER